jgi:hypothetical protein
VCEIIPRNVPIRRVPKQTPSTQAEGFRSNPSDSRSYPLHLLSYKSLPRFFLSLSF